jgi:hypothetical protein
MYSTEEIKETLKSEKLRNGECWINVREADHKKIKGLIEDKEELSIDELTDLVNITEDEVVKAEDINLKIINNKISEAEGMKQLRVVQKDIIQVYVKHKKGTDNFYITKAQDISNKKDL